MLNKSIICILYSSIHNKYDTGLILLEFLNKFNKNVKRNV